MTALALDGLFSNFLADALNENLADQLSEGTLNLLVAVVEDDRLSGSLTIAIGNAAAIDGGFRFESEPDPVPGAWHGARFETAEPTGLSLTVHAFEPPVLPLKYLRIQGYFEPDGSVLRAGTLNGCLTQKDAQVTTIMGMSLDDFLQQTDGRVMDIDTDTDGTMDAYSMHACFTAEMITLR